MLDPDEQRALHQLLAKHLPSIQDVFYSSRHLALSLPEMIEGLHAGTIVFRYVDSHWRAVFV